MIKNFKIFAKALHYINKHDKLYRQAKKLLKQGKKQEAGEFIQGEVNKFADYCMEITGCTLEVTGLENIPTDRAVVYIANHQGLLDMILMMGSIPYPKGFIAKIETLKIPKISTWMKIMDCVFMDRKNMKKSVQAIYDGIEIVKSGHSMVIFPEGTRSRGGPVKPFKAGSFKLAFGSGADIIPVSIDGTWHAYEETGKITGCPLRLTVHPSVKTAGLSKQEQNQVVAQVQKTIESALTQLSFKEPIAQNNEAGITREDGTRDGAKSEN